VRGCARDADRGTKPVSSGLALIVCALTAAACGGGDGNGPGTPPQQGTEARTEAAVEPITVDLGEANKSGQSGTATLTDHGVSASGISLGTSVALEVSPPKRFPDDAQPAAIHNATCAELERRRGFEELSVTEIQPLGEVRDGRSETTAAKSLAELTAGGFAISVHQPSPPFRAVVCGDIPSR
jgi:hypothetical protein